MAYQDRPWYQWILIPHELAHQWFGDYVTTQNDCVITSYSIHYTKLYEAFRQIGVNISHNTRNPGWLLCLPATPIVTGVDIAESALYARVPKAVFFIWLHALPMVRIADYSRLSPRVRGQYRQIGHRITSYNVCYTKLLRIQSHRKVTTKTTG